jgi:hypothetical protein
MTAPPLRHSDSTDARLVATARHMSPCPTAKPSAEGHRELRLHRMFFSQSPDPPGPSCLAPAPSLRPEPAPTQGLRADSGLALNPSASIGNRARSDPFPGQHPSVHARLTVTGGHAHRGRSRMRRSFQIPTRTSREVIILDFTFQRSWCHADVLRSYRTEATTVPAGRRCCHPPREAARPRALLGGEHWQAIGHSVREVKAGARHLSGLAPPSLQLQESRQDLAMSMPQRARPRVPPGRLPAPGRCRCVIRAVTLVTPPGVLACRQL